MSPDRQHYRACGVELLEVSAVYESRRVDDPGVAMVLALVGRVRRLLRAAYLLADDGLELEAAGPRRALIEYVLTVRWLLTNPVPNLMIWQHDDARRRLLVDDGVRASGADGGMTPQMRADTERLRDEVAATLASEHGIERPRKPSVEEMAAELPFAYVTYRFDSQVGTHPSLWAAEQLVSTEDGEFQLHPDPVRGEQGQPETYGVCAYSLLELLAMVDEFHDEPMIEPGRLEAIRAKLHA